MATAAIALVIVAAGVAADAVAVGATVVDVEPRVAKLCVAPIGRILVALAALAWIMVGGCGVAALAIAQTCVAELDVAPVGCVEVAQAALASVVVGRRRVAVLAIRQPGVIELYKIP